MKASHLVVALFCVVLLMQVGDACLNTANAQHPSRRADSAGFVLTGFSAFDRRAYSPLLHHLTTTIFSVCDSFEVSIRTK
jgi:hypothetical protein